MTASLPVAQQPEQASQSLSKQVTDGEGGLATVAGRGYNPQVLAHFVSPRNVGRLDPADPRVGTAEAGSRDQGAVVRIQLRVDESGIIKDICFKAYGCGATIAAASWVTEWAKGKPLERIAELHSASVIQALSLPPVKTHCAMLAEDAIKAAVDHYMQRQE